MTDTLRERAEKLDEQITKNTWMEAFKRKEFRPRVDLIEQALRDERERCAKIVEATVTCECKPEFCECYGWSTLERIAAAIRKDDTHEQQGGTR